MKKSHPANDLGIPLQETYDWHWKIHNPHGDTPKHEITEEPHCRRPEKPYPAVNQNWHPLMLEGPQENQFNVYCYGCHLGSDVHDSAEAAKAQWAEITNGGRSSGIINLADHPKIEEFSLKRGDVLLTSLGRMVVTELHDDGTAIIEPAPGVPIDRHDE
jgi:hypothetical protein